MDQAGKSFGLMKQVSSLESRVYDLMSKIAHLKECDSFLVGIIESACENCNVIFLKPLVLLVAFFRFDMSYSVKFFKYFPEPCR
jgi:hypothetical protein